MQLGVVAVGVREPQEEVADGAQARFLGGAGELGPDPVEVGQRTLERGGARRPGGGEEGVARRRRRPREAAYWAASSHHQLGWPPSCTSISTPSAT